MKRDASKRGFRGVVAASVLMGALILPAGLAHATGIEKIGPWSVVTYDKADGARDVAAIVSDSGSKLGLAIRCVDASLSIALVPLSDDLLFGTARRASLLSGRRGSCRPPAVSGAPADAGSRREAPERFRACCKRECRLRPFRSDRGTAHAHRSRTALSRRIRTSCRRPLPPARRTP
jgi:hypothetical protein